MNSEKLMTIITFGQFLLAIASFWLAWKVSKQTDQIRALSDVTDTLIKQNKELNNQTKQLLESNKIMQKGYELEDLITLEDRIPFFKRHQTDEQLNYEKQTFTIHVMNEGKKAFSISATGAIDEIFTIFVRDHVVEHNYSAQIILTFKTSELLREYLFEINLVFETDYNIEMYQVIKRHDIHKNQIRVYPPQRLPSAGELLQNVK